MKSSNIASANLIEEKEITYMAREINSHLKSDDILTIWFRYDFVREGDIRYAIRK